MPPGLASCPTSMPFDFACLTSPGSCLFPTWPSGSPIDQVYLPPLPHTGSGGFFYFCIIWTAGLWQNGEHAQQQLKSPALKSQVGGEEICGTRHCCQRSLCRATRITMVANAVNARRRVPEWITPNRTSGNKRKNCSSTDNDQVFCKTITETWKMNTDRGGWYTGAFQYFFDKNAVFFVQRSPILHESFVFFGILSNF